MKTTVIIPSLNNLDLINENIKNFTKDNTPSDFDVLVVDNGSDEEFKCDLPGIKVIRYDKPFGSYPIFKIALENTESDILAFFHSDFFVWDNEWYKKVEQAFNNDSKLGLLGMIGASGWAFSGGRVGTMGSFQGKTLGRWSGSAASIHGEDVTGQIRDASQLDGCSMIFRRSCLESLPLDSWDIPHHWYDRLLCAWCIERDWKIGVIGIECDHFSGQTANGSEPYEKIAKEWAYEKLGITEPTQWITKNQDWVNNTNNLDHGISKLTNWDQVLYQEGQMRFMKEFRDTKHLIPR